MFLPRRLDRSATSILPPRRSAQFLKWTSISGAAYRSSRWPLDPVFTRRRCEQRHHARRSLSIASSIHGRNLDFCFRSHRLTLPPSPRPHQDAFHRSLTKSLEANFHLTLRHGRGGPAISSEPEIGGCIVTTDWPKLGPSLMIATALVLAIRTAKWPVTFSQMTANPR